MYNHYFQVKRTSDKIKEINLSHTDKIKEIILSHTQSFY